MEACCHNEAIEGLPDRLFEKLFVGADGTLPSRVCGKVSVEASRVDSGSPATMAYIVAVVIIL